MPAGDGGSAALKRALSAARDPAGVISLLPQLEADPRPHLIAIAWVTLAQIASRQPAPAATAADAAGRAEGTWHAPGAPAAGGAGARGRQARAGGPASGQAGPGLGAGASAQEFLEACGRLQPLTRSRMAAMQFNQVAGLFWAWGRLQRRLGARPVAQEAVQAAAAQAAACPTAAEASGAPAER